MAKDGTQAQEHEGLTSQSEDYLEVIAELQKEDHVARAKDIADRLGVTRGTVTSALKNLHEKGLINYQPYSHITLTGTGENLAASIIHRHETLTRYLQEVLRLPSETAEANACRAEHVLDIEVIEQMVSFLKFLDKYPRTSRAWRQAFDIYCKGGEDTSDCKDCVSQGLAEIYKEEE